MSEGFTVIRERSSAYICNTLDPQQQPSPRDVGLFLIEGAGAVEGEGEDTSANEGAGAVEGEGVVESEGEVEGEGEGADIGGVGIHLLG